MYQDDVFRTIGQKHTDVITLLNSDFRHTRSDHIYPMIQIAIGKCIAIKNDGGFLWVHLCRRSKPVLHYLSLTNTSAKFSHAPTACQAPPANHRRIAVSTAEYRANRFRQVGSAVLTAADFSQYRAGWFCRPPPTH